MTVRLLMSKRAAGSELGGHLTPSLFARAAADEEDVAAQTALCLHRNHREDLFRISNNHNKVHPGGWTSQATEALSSTRQGQTSATKEQTTLVLIYSG